MVDRRPIRQMPSLWRHEGLSALEVYNDRIMWGIVSATLAIIPNMIPHTRNAFFAIIIGICIAIMESYRYKVSNKYL